MKTAFLNFNQCKDNYPSEINFQNVGINSGNIVFSYALKETIKCESLTTGQLYQRAGEFEQLVVRDFITISESSDLKYFDKTLEMFKNKKIIPISVGLQSPLMNPHFKIHPHAVNTLKAIQERAVLGVRGEYSADILCKHGIKNIRVIGCPSMYLGTNFEKKIEKKSFNDVQRVLSNYKTITNEINNANDLELLKYMKNNTDVFVEQTRCYASKEVLETALSDVFDFLYKNKRYFFIFEDWLEFVQGFDFCIGGRFHGNVVPLLSGVPALFIASDSRTKEMTDFFELPTIYASEFDSSKPLEYYYDKADYSNFNKNYGKKLENFIDFCLGNNLELTGGVQQFLYRKQIGFHREKKRSLLKTFGR